MEDKESLLQELIEAAKQTRRYGWRNYICAYIVAGVAVSGSITATILTSVKVVPSWITAIIAAIPAIVLGVNTTFHFEQRAMWHWRTTKRFEGLIRKLRYENADEAEVSKEYSEIDMDTFIGWTAYSSLSGSDGNIQK